MIQICQQDRPSYECEVCEATFKSLQGRDLHITHTHKQSQKVL
jgi:hypothetical protein